MSKHKLSKVSKTPRWARKLKAAMTAQGVTVAALAKACGVLERVVYWWREGRHVPAIWHVRVIKRLVKGWKAPKQPPRTRAVRAMQRTKRKTRKPSVERRIARARGVRVDGASRERAETTRERSKRLKAARDRRYRERKALRAAAALPDRPE